MLLFFARLSLAQPAVLATWPPTVHGRLAFSDDDTLIEIERAQITVYGQGSTPYSYSADGPFVGEGSTPSLSVLERGPTGLWAVYLPNAGIPRIRDQRPETPTWHLTRGHVAWTADPALCRVPVGADNQAWLAVNTTDLDCSEAGDLQVFAHDGASRSTLPLPPGFRLQGHDTQLLPVAALGDGVVWAIADGRLWRHDGSWTSPLDGAFTHVLAHGDRVLPVRKAGGWALGTDAGEVLTRGDEPVLRAVFSDDGRWLAIGLQDELRVLDTRTGQDRVPPRTGPYQSPHAFSASGDLLAVAVSGQPHVLGFGGASLPPAGDARFRGAGLVSRTPEDLACRGSIRVPASGAVVWLEDAAHGVFPTKEAPVVDGVARFDDVPCGHWRVTSTDFTDLRVGAGETVLSRSSWSVRVVTADGSPVNGARVTMYDLDRPALRLGVTDAEGSVGGVGELGPFRVLMAETADGVGARRSGEHRVVVTLAAKDALWHVRALDGDGQPVPGVALAIPGVRHSAVGPSDTVHTNDAGDAWLPAEARQPSVRVSYDRAPTSVSDAGVFHVSTGRVVFDPVDDGLRLLLVDALGTAHQAGASQGQIRRELTRLPAGPARLEAWRGDVCAVLEVDSVDSAHATPPEPSTPRLVPVEVRQEDGHPIAAAEVWRAPSTDLSGKGLRRTVADDMGKAHMPACSETDLFVAADPVTGRWGLAVGSGPVVTRLGPSARAALVLGPAGVVAEPSEELGLRRFDRVVRWGRGRTTRWTTEDAALAVWGAAGPVKVKVQRQDGGKFKLVVRAPSEVPAE